MLPTFTLTSIFVLTTLLHLTTSTKYKYQSYTSLVTSLQTLATTFPTLCTLKTSQEEFNIGTVGKCDDVVCKHYYLTIADSSTITSDDWSNIPDLFFSGEVHGDETVGPLATFHAAEVLLTAAGCSQSYDPTTPPNQRSIHCKTWFDSWQYTADTMYNLSYLVSSRRIVISPMSNPLGFAQIERTENNIDPNRDFAYDVKRNTQCMQTITARHINELFVSHLFQIGITFHGGMTCIAYEWGAPHHNQPHSKSPDDTAQKQIAEAMSDYAGTFKSEKKYPVDTMNSIVYPVNGGMEDWAYATSWDTELTVEGGCKPVTYGGYSREKTVYNDSVLRSFNILVETSLIKNPNEKDLGDRVGLFEKVEGNSFRNGHVPRNIRLLLQLVDVVQPYLDFNTASTGAGAGGVVSTKIVNHDRIAGVIRTDTSCAKAHVINVGKDVKEFNVSWVVNGGFIVDETSLFVSTESGSGSDNNGITCNTRQLRHSPQQKSLINDQTKYTQTPPQKSTPTKWMHSSDFSKQTIYSATITVTDSHRSKGVFSIVPFAVVDQHWSSPASGAGDVVMPSGLGPQSHIVNARTNPEWSYGNGGKMVRGGREWYGDVLTVVLVEGGGVGDAGVRGEVCIGGEDNGINGTSVDNTTNANTNSTAPTSTPITPKTNNIPPTITKTFLNLETYYITQILGVLVLLLLTYRYCKRARARESGGEVSYEMVEMVGMEEEGDGWIREGDDGVF